MANELYEIGQTVWFDDAWGEVLDARDRVFSPRPGAVEYLVWWQSGVQTWVWDSDLHSNAERHERGADDRCWSCEHTVSIHDSAGMCWFTASQGKPGVNLVCQCSINPEDL